MSMKSRRDMDAYVKRLPSSRCLDLPFPVWCSGACDSDSRGICEELEAILDVVPDDELT